MRERMVAGADGMSVDSTDSLELLKAALTMAAVDGKISGHENALLKALAKRAGVGSASLDAMIKQAGENRTSCDDLFKRAVKDSERAMQLLVAAANIDGHISEEERNLLVDISFALGVSAERFNAIFQAGLATSKRIRRGREE